MGIVQRNIKHTDEMPNNCSQIALSHVIIMNDCSVHYSLLELKKKNQSVAFTMKYCPFYCLASHEGGEYRKDVELFWQHLALEPLSIGIFKLTHDSLGQ